MQRLLAVAIAPTLICLIYIYIRDKYEKEPFRLLATGVVFGIISIFPIMQIEHMLTGFMPALGRLPEAAYSSFLVASLTEQGFRYILLFFLTWQNVNLNERMDGIVYGVFISLGFAGIENILYVINPQFGGMDTAIMRAFISVPAHGFFGVVMGYFFAMAKFEPKARAGYLLKAFFVPWIIHGIYDTILLSGSPYYLVAFVPFLAYIWYSGFKKIRLHLDSSPFKGADI